MCEYFCQFSEEIHVPDDKKQAVVEFLEEFDAKAESEGLDWTGEIEFVFPGRDTYDGGTVFKLYAVKNFLDTELLFLVRGILKAIDSDDPVTISFATTCSSPIVNSFGGGTYIVWQDRDEYIDSELIALSIIHGSRGGDGPPVEDDGACERAEWPPRRRPRRRMILQRRRRPRPPFRTHL